MTTTDRMFHVIVLGGIALASVPLAAAAVGCGGSVMSSSNDAGFPVEGRPPEQDAFPQEGPAAYDVFPQETATVIDAGHVTDASPDVVDAFPQEGPAMIDSGRDVFPQETAQILDSGHDADDAQG